MVWELVVLHGQGIVYVISSGDMVIMGKHAPERQALVSSMAHYPQFLALRINCILIIDSH